ncbi:helix-turn-helix domain-containing protein [Actinomadura rayongensis]|uniref:Helix-turn-helix domain-containing protein n=1 Tax=Actinomadura rayongensis TaxID=1429076 RepID=A0A6I4W246_9ACTN|nr:helix-turn-helix transcriptional regulator [Actinomadura rayongensis]MXQ64649.1 helix-turn-helix domain-containing protein [Actinomadura rayongensis]
MAVDRRKADSWRLGLYLRRTRELLDLSYERAAEHIGCDVDWLVRVETGFASLSTRHVRHILERYQAADGPPVSGPR